MTEHYTPTSLREFARRAAGHPIDLGFSEVIDVHAHAWDATQQQLDFHLDVVKQYRREAEKLKDALEAAEQTIEETAFILAYRPGDISHGRAFDLALARLRRDAPNAGRVPISTRKENSP